jgi:hypothetical protein
MKSERRGEVERGGGHIHAAAGGRAPPRFLHLTRESDRRGRASPLGVSERKRGQIGRSEGTRGGVAELMPVGEDYRGTGQGRFVRGYDGPEGRRICTRDGGLTWWEHDAVQRRSQVFDPDMP